MTTILLAFFFLALLAALFSNSPSNSEAQLLEQLEDLNKHVQQIEDNQSTSGLAQKLDNLLRTVERIGSEQSEKDSALISMQQTLWEKQALEQQMANEIRAKDAEIHRLKYQLQSFSEKFQSLQQEIEHRFPDELKALLSRHNQIQTQTMQHQKGVATNMHSQHQEAA